MPKRSAGLLMYRRSPASPASLEVLLVHPGGPFWAHKDKGAWTIPKGEPEAGEDLLLAAQREFAEETGFTAHGPFAELGVIQQAGGKIVSAWAFEGDCDPRKIQSKACKVEWPPRSNRLIEVPEVDRGDWFTLAAAKEYILSSQGPLLERLAEVVRGA